MMTTTISLISSIPTSIRDDMAFKVYPDRLQSQEVSWAWFPTWIESKHRTGIHLESLRYSILQ